MPSRARLAGLINIAVGSGSQRHITPHLRWGEFACHNGIHVPARLRVNVLELCEQLEVIRGYWDRPMTILSGYRTPEWNAKIDGAEKSMHCQGKAADIQIAGVAPAVVHTIVLHLISTGDLRDGGVGKYARWVHYDIGKPRRWRG